MKGATPTKIVIASAAKPQAKQPRTERKRSRDGRWSTAILSGPSKALGSLTPSSGLLRSAPNDVGWSGWLKAALCCVFLLVGGLCCATTAFADPEINLKNTFIPDTLVQKSGCLSGEGLVLHSECNLTFVMDLTKPFHTPEKFTFVVTQGPSGDMSDAADLQFCFLKAKQAVCKPALIPCGVALTENSSVFLSGPCGVPWPYNEWDSASVIVLAKPWLRPLLEINPYEFNGGPGAPYGLVIYAYRQKSDTFELIFSGTGHRNVNAETRLITTGPLAGDVAADYPTERAPYRYEVTLYRLTASEHYIKVLDYYGKSEWGDGNSLAVTDAETPEIEKRMGVWRTDQPLPAPSKMPANCRIIQMRNGLEWCN